MFDYIKAYNDVLDKQFCEDAIAKFNSKDNPIKRQLEKHMIFDEINLMADGWSDEYNYVLGQMKKVLQTYVQSTVYDPTVMFPRDYNWEEVRMKKYYASEGIFNDHVDVGNHPSAKRFLSFLIYLNDVKEGGNTVFYSKDQEASIKPKQGSVIVFPPMWMFPHRGETPRSGDKYIMSTYLHYKD